MNNPDEKSAAEQFGKGDKYVGVATLLATLPGLPMFGHGQFEGFAEKYGMEFRRASMDEQPDQWLIERHEREIVPLLHRRGDFAEARDFLLYDVAADGGGVDEHVFAYSNGSGPSRSLVVYHNRYAETAGWIRDSVAFALKAADGSKSMVRRSLAEGLGRGRRAGRRPMARACASSAPASSTCGPCAEVRERGVHVALRAYETRVFWELRELSDAAGVWARLAERLGGRGVPSLEGALRELQLTPGARRAAGGDRRSRRGAAVGAARRRRRGGDGHGRRSRGGRGRGGAARSTRDRGRSSPGSTTRRRSRRCASGRCSRRSGRLPRVPTSGRRAGPGTRSCGSRRSWRGGAAHRRASTRPAPGGPPSGCACCSTCRCRRRWAAAAPTTAAAAARGRVARRPGRPLVPAGQPLGRRRLVPPRVVGRAARLDGPPRARPDAGRRPRAPTRRALRRRRVASPKPPMRPATRSRGSAPRSPSRPSHRRHRESTKPRLPKATGLPPGPASPKTRSGKDGPPSA